MTKRYQGHDLFVSHLFELEDRCLKRSQTIMTSFLTPAEQKLVKERIREVPVFFDGGYDAAERKIAVFSFEENPKADLCCLKAGQNPKERKIEHPDLLGALLHAGLERSVIGDLICTDDFVYLICKDHMKDFIRQNVTRVARTQLDWQEIEPENLPVIERELLKVNVASLRTDAVVAALAHTSRSRAMDMIRQGMIKINDLVLDHPVSLCNNDLVSIRRAGRFQFVGVEGKTRKDRLVLRFLKYA